MRSNDSTRAGTAYRALSPANRWTLWAAVAAVALFSGAIGCAPQEQGGTDLTPQEEQALADTIETQIRQIADALSQTQPDSYFPHYSEDLRYYFRTWYDRAEFEDYVRGTMTAHQEIQATFEEIDVRALGPDAAVATGNYRVQPVDTTGRTREERAYAYTAVFERSNGQWKVVRLHESAAQ